MNKLRKQVAKKKPPQNPGREKTLAGCAVIESGTGAVATERVAILLVPLPTELLTTKVNWAPLSELVSAAGGGRAADGCAIFVGDDATTSATSSSSEGPPRPHRDDQGH